MTIIWLGQTIAMIKIGLYSCLEADEKKSRLMTFFFNIIIQVDLTFLSIRLGGVMHIHNERLI
jgi:small basic protein